MRSLKIVLVMVAMSLLAFGCGKQSALEGKVVDGQGQPIGGLKVIAKQVQPMKGYEQLETTTASDGTFRFDELSRKSEYVLKAWSQAWSTEDNLTVQSGPRGRTKVLVSPMVIRFTVSAEGVIRDSKTGLEWYVGPDTGTNWDQAARWVADLSVSGGGWRLPTIAELGTLHEPRMGGRNLSPIFKTTGSYVWSGEMQGPSSARIYRFGGNPDPPIPYDAKRVFAVRPRKD